MAGQKIIVQYCKHCRKEYWITAAEFNRGRKYCSYECRVKDGHITIACGVCGKEITILKSKYEYGQRHCCKACVGISQRKGNRHSAAMIRRSEGMKAWRKKVFERDEYTCRICGQVGGRLNAHHIIPFSVDYALRNEVGNGMTLCDKCHKKVHAKEKQDIQLNIFSINYNVYR
jgi:5-methylcytosine-specific restriction endonuclease McrA